MTRAACSKNPSIALIHSSYSRLSQPAAPKKLSRIFLRLVSLLIIKFPRLYGGSVRIKLIEWSAIPPIAWMQSPLYSNTSDIFLFLPGEFLFHRALSAFHPFFQFGASEFPLLAYFMSRYIFIFYPLAQRYWLYIKKQRCVFYADIIFINWTGHVCTPHLPHLFAWFSLCSIADYSIAHKRFWYISHYFRYFAIFAIWDFLFTSFKYSGIPWE